MKHSGEPAGADVKTMTGENEKKGEAKIGSRIKNLFSSGCGCGGGGCCGTKIVPKAKKEEPETKEE
ncbi:hypothetical protein DIC75_02105 [Methanoculleus sp. CWC-02]|uniref:Uncharacterized protein n=1 Tax=Methanoculleus oceani TaxID=2184756 RepID=A0ABD4TB66_9EURY|nr:hypothetical protein [Methanoculleus sp. CWC-02]